MTEEEQKLFRLYGKLPNKKDLLQNKLKVSPASSVELRQVLTDNQHLNRSGSTLIPAIMPWRKLARPLLSASLLSDPNTLYPRTSRI